MLIWPGTAAIEDGALSIAAHVCEMDWELGEVLRVLATAGNIYIIAWMASHVDEKPKGVRRGKPTRP